jgi:uroporphyrin-III C-methyltransferase / precorrin-2 dehydrogenase / sirohydrochlorin ferrochelatase
MVGYTIFFKLQNQTCLVVVGGEIAAGKIQQLLRSGADVIVVALKIEPSLNN